ncbi:cadherin-87A-like isoform X2 [Brevipalpus obovatus]|uniref:cadherin-87A-like isoform X2 n=1 Tax=Brevipalpus obovatus TaxID=246614 RepID=UPI003D9EEB70
MDNHQVKGNRTLLFICSNLKRFLTSVLFIILVATIKETRGQRSRSGRSSLAFLPGGDMSGLHLTEDTKVGSAIYQLRANEPTPLHHHYGGKRKISFYISGDAFSVTKDTGIVTLIRPLDREKEAILDVIITIVEESLPGKPEDTLSIKREIIVDDANDNRPQFIGGPFKYAISESVKVFTTIIENLKVTDSDAGSNAHLDIKCNSIVNQAACDTFQIHTSNTASGVYIVSVSLRGVPLNYETTSSYTLPLIAIDKGGLSSDANITIDVIDVQDEPPKFLNGPYSITVNESTPSGTNVLTIIARDGDDSPSIKRDIDLELLYDVKGYFALARSDQDSWTLVTSDRLMDREDPEVLLNGAIYHLALRASEIVGNAGSASGAISFANLTVVIQDINDQEPKFNLDHVNLLVPEDITNGSAVPGLNLVAYDLDTGHNAKFSLSLEDIDPSHPVARIFSVSPSLAMGRTPVIIKLINSNQLDYEDERKRNFMFNVVATQGTVRSIATINMTLVDTNDNYPQFDRPEYHAKVLENQVPQQVIYTIKASDSDSGNYGKITYHLKGFGSEKFHIDPESGQISVAQCLSDSYARNPSAKGHNTDNANSPNNDCLDFETQPTYSLRIEAIDGGGKRATANLHIEIVDVNDNVPQFVRSVYVRELHERDSHISPPLVLRAMDADGPSQGGPNGIRYRIKWSNLTGLAIDPVTGEMKLTKAIEANFTRNPDTGSRKKLNYEAIIEAIDGGQPPLTAEATVQMYVRSERDGEPMFINEPYIAVVKENAPPGSVVIQVKATDPDGPDSKIRYSIVSGAKDSFVIDPVTGEVRVSPTGDLDRDVYGGQYTLTIAATDSGVPNPLISTAEITINVEDVNNKPPKFVEDSYVAHLSEKQMVPNYEIIKVEAKDPDSDAKIRYSLDGKRMKIHDKTGAQLSNPSSERYFASLLKIDPINGSVRVNNAIDPQRASIIIIQILAKDVNAPPKIATNRSSTTDDHDGQTAHAELTLYLQSYSEKSPLFNSPWSPSSPKYEINLPEEMSIGSTVLTLAAKNPATGKPISDFRKIVSTDGDDIFEVDKNSGLVTVNKRIDFEQLTVKQLKFSVEAHAQWMDEQSGKIQSSSSIADILVTIADINDNSPTFSQDFYRSSVMESARWPQHVLTVQASDKDSDRYGRVAFSLSGDGANLFEINNQTGAIRVKSGAILDREVKSSYNLQITAFDNVDLRSEGSTLIDNQDGLAATTESPYIVDGGRLSARKHRKTTVFAKIELLDDNDNAPKFSEENYQTIIPESLAVGTKINSVHATDPDAGDNGMVQYEISFMEGFHDPRESLFRIEPMNGEIFVNSSLSGKGRSEPYILHIRAFDNGHPQQSSIAKFSIIIGDISANDGVPRFVKPAENEIIYLNENSKPNVLVYQVEAVDADNKNSPNGKVMYKFAEPSPYFDIDSIRGTITTSRSVGRSVFLDREKRENFTLILVAFDLGSPPQESQRVLVIRLNDTDDNQPLFRRSVDSPPMIFTIDEELPFGTEIGHVEAIDEDANKNGEIAYQILRESLEDAIKIESRNKAAYFKINRRLDREEISEVELLIQAKNPSKIRAIPEHEKIHINYQPSDLSQIRVKFVLNDIDDNPPKFERSSYVEAIRWDMPLNSDIMTFAAKDPDPNDSKNIVQYNLIDTQYIFNDRPFLNVSHVFDLNKHTGVLRNDIPLKSFVGGYFILKVQAKVDEMAKDLYSIAIVKLFVLRGSDQAKFVFTKSPNIVQDEIDELKDQLQQTLVSMANLNWRINFQEIHFQERKDGSLDFESSSTCFQVFKVAEDDSHGDIVSFSEAIRPLRNSSKLLRNLYEHFGILSVEECVKPTSSPLLSRHELGVVLIALFIATFSIILAFIASTTKKNYRKQMNSVYINRSMMIPNGSPGKPLTIINVPNQDRISEWQEIMNPQLDALSARSLPTIR